MTESISVLGCGWLGFPLAKTLLAQGYEIHGSTTQPEKLNELEEKGIKPYLIKLSPEVNAEADPNFFRSDVLIINIPPRRRTDVEAFYPQQVEAIIQQSPSPRIVFVSSTSVYPDLNRAVTEADIPTSESEKQSLRASGRAILAAESLVKQYSSQTTILRFCGLMGPDRHPGRFLAGKTLNSSGQAPVNFIHLDDCVAILAQIIRDGIWGEVFNACADEHPTKSVFYQRATQKIGQKPPEFRADGELSFKQIDSQRLKGQLGYQFIYADPTKAL
ncbi:MAG: SDR family oxidoreductase [Bacteroidota bacterium]